MEARKLKDKATEAFTKGRFSKAAELYEEYCRADPKDHQSRLRTGDAWAKAGQRDRAISAYQAAAEGFAKEGFLPRAIAASKLILELDPSHQGVQQMLADLYARRATPAGAKARGPMGSALSTPPPVSAPEPAAKSRLPDAVRAAVAEIDLDVDVEVDGAAAPEALEAGGTPVDLSSELPAELSLSTGVSTAGEEVVHSVSVGVASLDTEATAVTLEVEGADEPILMGEPVEETREAEAVVVGQALPEELASTEAPPVSAPAVAAAPVPAVSTPVSPASAAAPDAHPPARPGTVAVSEPVSGPAPAVAAARPATSSLPPGLAPRSSQRMAVPAALRQPASNTAVAPPLPPVKNPSGKWKALSSPIAAPVEADSGAASASADSLSSPVAAPGSAAPLAAGSAASSAPGSAASSAPGSASPSAPVSPESSPATSSAPPGLRQRRAAPQAPAGATALPLRELSPGAAASSFTELELEADSLLHAVELAAQAGLSQRAALAVPSGTEEEEVYSLTEEVGPDGRAPSELPTVPLFSDLPHDAFIELFERCPLRRFGPGERIIEQGTRGDAFYVICEGSVRVFRTEDGQRQDLATLEGGACFGEMALLSGAARTASVEGAAEDTQLLEISAPVLAELSRRYPLVAQALKKFVRQRMLTNVMNTSALFRPFNRKDRRTLVERFRARDVEREDVIIRDGDQTDGLYVVLSGEVEVSKDGLLLTRLKEGDLFGEISLLQKTPATATVTATRHTTLLRLPREDFDMLISSHPQILVLISELSDARLLRTQKVLSAAASGAPAEGDEELILV